jgi:LacI family transcriptional regulator
MNLVRSRVLVTTRYETRFSRETFRGIVAYIRRHTNWDMLCQVNVTAAEWRAIRPAGVIAIGEDSQTHRWARAAGIPLVMDGPVSRDPRASLADVDERGIGALAVDHFAGLGLKHLAYASHGSWRWAHTRQACFVRAARARDYGPVTVLMGPGDSPRQRLRFENDLKILLENLPRPCGLLAANDEAGVVIVRTCRSIGLRVPDDIAVLGVDNDELTCELSAVPLSSIVRPRFSIGYEVARALHEHLEDPTMAPTRLLLPPQRVVVRASTDLIAIDDEDVVAALRLIKAHFDQPINVDWIVQQLPVARRSLDRKFVKLVGRTVLHQIHHVRFQKAKELLAESDLSLELVARRSGFVNVSWLTHSFRRELDSTPMRFRRQFRTES